MCVHADCSPVAKSLLVLTGASSLFNYILSVRSHYSVSSKSLCVQMCSPLNCKVSVHIYWSWGGGGGGGGGISSCYGLGH